MITLSPRAYTLALASMLGAVVLVAAPAAWADDESDAREACKEIAQNRDWDDADTEVQREGENRIIVTVTGERSGDDKERRCVYDISSKEARFSSD